MTALRTLAGVESAARRLGLEVFPTELREVLFECPRCKGYGLRALACVELILGVPVVRCAGCEAWGDDPFNILLELGHDPDAGEPYELVLRIFELLWTMHRLGRAARESRP
jgi:hypothetical protein